MPLHNKIFGMLLIIFMLLLTGCDNKFLTQYSGKKIGICVSIEKGKPYNYFVPYLHRKLVEEVNKKNMNAVFVKSEQWAGNRQKVFDENSLDYLLCIDLLNLNEEDYERKSQRIYWVLEYYVTLSYDLYEKEQESPVISGKSNGYYKKFYDKNKRTVNVDTKNNFYRAMVDALKKSEL